MKVPSMFFTIALFTLLHASSVFAQCPTVADNSFLATPTDNGNGTCTWAITFTIDNSGGDGNESMSFSLSADDNGNKVEINPGDDLCDIEGIPTSGIVINQTYTGGCDAIFILDWKSYENFGCPDPTCGSGSDISQEPAPVELVSFSGIAKEGTVELSWQTGSEEQNHYFEIQRSEDGKDFENVGMVEGQGTIETISHYRFVDKYALPFAYYRLKQVDFDGTFSFSEIINVKRGDFESNLMVYPTAVFNKITIRIKTLDTRKSFLKIANLSGQVIYERTYYGANDAEYLNLDARQYPPGIYYVSLTNKMETYTSKFIVAKD